MAGIGTGLAIVALIIAAAVAGLYFIFGLVWTMLICFVFVCLFMMGVVLMQKPRGGGLSGAFGGAGGNSQAVFGAKVGDVLTWVTVGAFIVFLGLAMGLTLVIHADVQAPPPTKLPVELPVELPADQPANPAAVVPDAANPDAQSTIEDQTPAENADADTAAP